MSQPCFSISHAESIEYHLIGNKKANLHNTVINLRWQPPHSNTYKLNTDESCAANPGKEGIGGVIRNSKGDWVMGFNKSFTHATNNLMELMALREGLTLDLYHKIKPLTVEVDSMEILNMFHRGNPLYDSIVNACRFLLESLKNSPVQYIYREQNRVADMLAKQGSEKDLFDRLRVYVTPPANVGVVFWEDLEGKTISQSINAQHVANQSSFIFAPG
ncbi:uncharacterized protein LOC124887876 [Capsicum annuum]|uniref:uncharacterized protein LOC124887876 n=1 Tax=Capsicum annuum TaxID=4072 RepID=UPI001FB0A672|nr:uncharacterized protein LOC124887876 [Capsicum annuum]